MENSKQIPKIAFGAILFLSIALLPITQARASGIKDPKVVVYAGADQVRFVCLGEGVHMKLEVFDSAGQPLLDSEFSAGNVLNWPLTGRSQQQRLADGSYLIALTVKEISGRTNPQFALLSVQQGNTTVEHIDSRKMTQAQAQVLEASHQASNRDEENNDLIIIKEGEAVATSLLAHDGADGQLVVGSGALSIMSGDYFARKVVEQIRLTAEGDLGIGTSNPQAKLDVAGLVRTSSGIVFPDGSIQFSAARKTFGTASRRASQSQDLAQGEEPHPSISGTGTTGQIPKWLDGPSGALGDSVISELNGSIGINGIPNPTFKLDVTGHNRFRGSNVSFYLTGVKPGGNEWLFQTVDADGRLRIFDNTSGAERFSVTQTGNVGIGTSTPVAKLDVLGEINTSTQYNIADRRVLSTAGTSNLFAGVNAGTLNTIGSNNSFFGRVAGTANTTGSFNSFFGSGSGQSNTGGSNNSFFGSFAGLSNTTSNSNSFFGYSAGAANLTGFSNSFFGAFAGDSNTTGQNNSFFGRDAGGANTTGSDNSFFGDAAGLVNTASFNSFFGRLAGSANSTACCNSFFGYVAGAANTTGQDNSFFGTSAGSANETGSENAFFGRSAGLANRTGGNNSFFGALAGDAATGSRNSFFGADAGGASTATSGNSFFGAGAGRAHTVGGSNSFFGADVGSATTTGGFNSFFGVGAGLDNTTGGSNAFFGRNAGSGNTTGSNNTAIGNDAEMTSGNLSFATAIGADASVSTSNTIVLGRVQDTVRVTGDLNVNGTISLMQLGSPGPTSLCYNGTSNEIAFCSSSLRYKDRLAPFTAGLELINRLRPITFNWKQSGERDLGLAAEDVAKVEPLLVTRNDNGQVEGVKYDRINVALINAVKQQQTQIELLRRQVEDLRKIVCVQHPNAKACK